MIPYCGLEIIEDRYSIIFLFWASIFKLERQTASRFAQPVWGPPGRYFVLLVTTVLRLKRVASSPVANDWGRVLRNLFTAFANPKIYHSRTITPPISGNLNLYEKDLFIVLEQEAISGL